MSKSNQLCQLNHKYLGIFEASTKKEINNTLSVCPSMKIGAHTKVVVVVQKVKPLAQSVGVENCVCDSENV